MDTWGGRRGVLGTVSGTGYTRSIAGTNSPGTLTSHPLWAGYPTLGLALGTLGQGRNDPG